MPLPSLGLLEQRALSSAAETLENDFAVCAEAVRQDLCPLYTWTRTWGSRCQQSGWAGSAEAPNNCVELHGFNLLELVLPLQVCSSCLVE